METIPVVSVCMITYGHEKFIKEAIEGVLIQECDFEVELIVANDCSPDNTNKVVQNILKTHSKASWIKYINHKQNLGMMANFIFALNQCKGKYIAICDGDDYWIDPFKLQKQINFLENNNQYVICFTKANRLFPNGEIKTGSTLNKPFKTGFDDIVFGNYIPALTVVFKNSLRGFNFPGWYNKSLIGDWPLYLWLTKDGGNICYLQDITSIYRFGVGVSNELRKDMIKLKKLEVNILSSILMDSQFSDKKIVVRKALSKKMLSLSTLFNSKKQFLNSLIPFLESLNYNFSFNSIKKYFNSIIKVFYNKI